MIHEFETYIEDLGFSVKTIPTDLLLSEINKYLQLDKCINSDTHPFEFISDSFKERLVKESFNDPLFFIPLMRVSAPEGYINLNLYEKQKTIVKSCKDDHYVIILGSRQTGKTTVTFAYGCWLLNFFDHYKIGLLVQKDDSLKKAIAEFDMLYTSLPSWMQYSKIKDDAREKHLSNGSKLQGYLVDPRNPDASGRGVKVDFLIIDEAAFINRIQKAYTALKPATSRRHLRLQKAGIPFGTIIISTPNGMYGIGKWYYDFWVSARKEINRFKAIKFHWSEVPEYDEEWFKRETADLSERDISQEYELVFFGSQNAYFPDSIIEKLQNNLIRSKCEYTDLKLKSGTVHLIDDIQSDTLYTIGVDPADTGADYSAIVIFDIFHSKPIGYYYEQNVSALDLLEDTLVLGKLIKNSIIIPERNAFSTNAQVLFKQLGNHRVYTVPDKRKKSDAYKYAGVNTNGVTRKQMLMSLYSFVDKNVNNILLEPLVDELISLEYKGSRIEAADGHHDDLIMAFSFSLYVLDFGKIEEYYPYFQIDRSEFKELSKNIKKITALNNEYINEVSNLSDPILQILLDERAANIEQREILDNIFEQNSSSTIQNFEP